ncbi:hypothetical protein JOF29_002890 [Kribbella aluminosa]|uniref:Uncharacterized protein n=1 Tax=Kribbella aluminosa TaxID=416017 RepID=A0ABS4UJI2_9ACTN|nr:hypothetical protein [Kribbella aluminosa]MBP2351807.1 hypothetical protein [Kribbella aluminosa]
MISPTFDLPAGEAGAIVTCGLWVYNAEEISEQTVRLLCEVRSNGEPWNDATEHTFPDTISPQMWSGTLNQLGEGSPDESWRAVRPAGPTLRGRYSGVVTNLPVPAG